MAERRAAVLGHPIAHSLSPVLHRAAYAALGLDGWRYDALDVTQEALADVVAGLDATWAGLSLTMPLKQAVLPLLDHIEPQAELLGVVNTVLVQGGGARPVLTGANTDVHGIVAALAEAGVTREAGSGPADAAPARRSAVVLGAGATAASALAALGSLGCTRPVVLARSMARAGTTIRAAHVMGLDATFRVLDPERARAALAHADVVVATLPPRAADGLAADLADALADVLASVPRSEPPVLLDCAYDPRPTALVGAWRAGGGVAVTGERMLLHQAVEQVRLMTGRPGPVAAMDRALQAALRSPVAQ